MPYLASIVYKAENDGQKYITFLGLPGNASDDHDEYFAKQVCMRHGWVHVSSRKESRSSRALTKDEREAGIIRKPHAFFVAGTDIDL